MSGIWSPSISSRSLLLACGCSSSSLCSPTSAGASSTSTSPSIPPPPGRPSRSWTPSRTTPRPPISCATVTRSTASQFRHRVKGMRIEEVLAAPHSPWQNPFAERLIGSIRRECLDHVLVLGESHLRRILARYFSYYHRARTHLALHKDAPDVRP